MNKQQKSIGQELVSKLMAGKTGQMKSYIAILLVSVGKENFEEEKLRSAIKMINLEFNGCCIVVADTLQRFNIATEKNISDSEAYEESVAKGNAWLTRYEPYFKDIFNVPYEIVRWDSLLNAQGFKDKEDIFCSMIKTNSKLKHAMAESIEEYGGRSKKRMGDISFELVRLQHERNCFSYLKEECIAISCLPQIMSLIDDSTPTTIVYPGKSTAILTANRAFFIKNEFCMQMEEHKDYLNWLAYRFNKVKKPVQTDLLKTLNLKNICGHKKETLSESKQINYANQLLEAQLCSLHNLLDDSSIYEFNTHVLEYLLDPYALCHEPITDSLAKQSIFSMKLLAFIFSNQMVTLFNYLEKKIANQCKANIVKILKKSNSNVSSKNREKFLVL